MQALTSLLKFVTRDKLLEPFFYNPQKYFPPAIAGPLNSLNSFNHRDGQAGGGWNGGGGTQGGSGGAPAISALALLGFLFFLNLIQNSLLLNRQLMTTTVVTTGTNASASASASAGTAVAVGRTEDEDVGEGRNSTGRRTGNGSGSSIKNASRRRRLLFRPKRSLAGGRNRNNQHVVDFLKEKYYNMTGTAGDMDVASRISRYKIPNVREPRMPMFPLLPPSPTYPNYQKGRVATKKYIHRTSDQEQEQIGFSSSPTSKPPDQIERPFMTNK